MTGLVEWLLAEIAEDERTALQVPEQYRQWEYSELDDEMRSGEMRRVAMLDTGRGTAYNEFDGLNFSDLRHIALNDPARVLAECNAKRRIIDAHHIYEDDGRFSCGLCGWDAIQGQEYHDQPGCETIRALASAFVGRPGYQETWGELA